MQYSVMLCVKLKIISFSTQFIEARKGITRSENEVLTNSNANQEEGACVSNENTVASKKIWNTHQYNVHSSHIFHFSARTGGACENWAKHDKFVSVPFLRVLSHSNAKDYAPFSNLCLELVTMQKHTD